jgi:hypothetical protein
MSEGQLRGDDLTDALLLLELRPRQPLDPQFEEGEVDGYFPDPGQERLGNVVPNRHPSVPISAVAEHALAAHAAQYKGVLPPKIAGRLA